MSDPPSASPEPWPDEPYKGLAYYNAADRLLYSGRDADVDACVRRLSASETRMLLIHGRTGCGKSSFLRAGLIPELEEQGPNFLFLPDADGSPVFIRSGADPLGRIAEQLYRFASEGVTLNSVKGPALHDLSAALLGHSDLASFAEKCRGPGTLTESLLAIAMTLPRTLVIILDQAEEVITLADPAKPYRRHFFRFVKEFSSVNFPVKFVIALRKDYSGQFVELAQMGGGIDLREEQHASDSGVPADASVRSDVKLYLLGELSRAKVERAIELPTDGVDRPQDATSAFARYRFRYAPHVVEHIACDLFEKSSTAVLPVMQIVCRELYKKKAPAEGTAAPSIIELDDYLSGGDISGPVDRHISESLRASFAPELKADEKDAEEQRWREVLLKFVRLESDGTAHTRFVDENEFRQIAAEHRTRTDVDRVINHLHRPEVLLLRRVSSETNASGVPGLSLGHDFLAMVLNRWKVGRQEFEAEQRRLAQFKKNVRKYAMVSVATVAVVIGLVYHFARLGGMQEAYKVLLNAADNQQRGRPVMAMTALALANWVADDIGRSSLSFARDDRADHMLATLMARLPAEDLAGSMSGQKPAPVVPTMSQFALPLSNGFLSVEGDRVSVSAAGWVGAFELATFEFPSGHERAVVRFTDQPVAEVSEVDKDGLLLLRTWPSVPGLFQLYLLRKGGEKLGPFGAETFRDAVPWLSGSRSLSMNSEQVVLSGSFIAFQSAAATLDPVRREYSLRAFTVDVNKPKRPFRPGLKLDLNLDVSGFTTGGITSPVFAGGVLVLPTPTGLQRFELRDDHPKGTNPITPAAAAACPAKCDWQWAPSIGSDRTALVFAPAVEQAGMLRSRVESSGAASLDGFSTLLLIELPSGRETVVSKSDIERAAETCAQSDKPASSLERVDVSTASAYVARGTGGPMLLLVAGQSVDVLQIWSERRTVTCRGSLIFFNRLDRWTATEDHGRLLGTGPNARATWDLTESIDDRKKRIFDAHDLRERACKAGMQAAIPKLKMVTNVDLPITHDTLCKPGTG